MRTIITTLCLLAITLATPAHAGDKAREYLDGAGKAYIAARKCTKRARKDTNPKNQFVENQKAIGHLRQAYRLMEKYLALKPNDSEAVSLMQNVTALLFWCEKMSPLEVDDEPETPKPDPAKEAAAKKKKADEAQKAFDAEARREAAEQAAAQLAAAKEFRAKNPKDGVGALARFYKVCEQYPATAAGQEAKTLATQLQAELYKAKTVVVKKKTVKPLTSSEKAALSDLLQSWINNRRKLRCLSCRGQGYSTCKTCDGSGTIHGRAGRRSSCRKCQRGKRPCKRSKCSEGIDTRFLAKVLIDARAPYYKETLQDLLGGSSKAIKKYLEALAAWLANSPRAPATISRCAAELRIDDVQLRDVIENHGPGRDWILKFDTSKLVKVDRRATILLRGEEERQERVSFEQQDGKWYFKRLK